VLGKKEILSTGLKKREGLVGWLGASVAPFLSYGTKYIQARECAAEGGRGGRRKITIYTSLSQALFFLFP